MTYRCLLLSCIASLAHAVSSPCLALSNGNVHTHCPFRHTNHSCVPLRFCRALPSDVATPAWSGCRMAQNFPSLCRPALEWEQAVVATANFSVCARSAVSRLQAVESCDEVRAMLACRPVRLLLEKFATVHAAYAQACPAGLQNISKNLNISHEYVAAHLVSMDVTFPVLVSLAAVSFAVVAWSVGLSPASQT